MAYFKTTYQTLQKIAQKGDYADLAAFLVLARHANGRPPAGLAPHKYSGAGVNAVHEKAGLSEETARGAVQRLQQGGFIRPAPAEAKKLSYLARWEIDHGEPDLDLPHLITDDSGNIESALRRIKTRAEFRKARSARQAELASLSDAELKLDLLMTLLAVYRHTSMDRFGGLSAQCCFRRWDVKNQASKLGGIRWGAEPDVTDRAFEWFAIECIGRGVAEKKTAAHMARFWTAWEALQSLGLVYEAVSMFDVDPTKNKAAQLAYTIRVNDYHAGSIDKAGDPSLLRLLESEYGTTYAYYTPVGNDRGEPEAMWVILPSEGGCLMGIYRPRFRSENKDAGSWFESDSENTAAVFRSIVSASA